MPALTLREGAGALLLIGLAWLPVGWVLDSLVIMLAGGAVASLGVVIAGFAPDPAGQPGDQDRFDWGEP